MNRTFKIAWLSVFALVVATGCRLDRTREFVAVQRPLKFENWGIYVNARVEAANPSPTNHLFVISAVAWTAPGDWIGPDVQFKSTTYDASLDSLRLFRIEGTNAAELPLPPLHHDSSDQPNRVVQLYSDNHIGIEIPANVKELRAEVVMTFRHRGTGKTETKVFAIKMVKRERTKFAPLE